MSQAAAVADPRHLAPSGTTAVILAFAAAKLLVHLLAAPGYGIFRDELYFIVCGWRLDWGYVDHPPMVPLLARLGTEIFGVSAFGVRFFAAIAGAALILFAGFSARELGGRRLAVTLSCTAAMVAPIYLATQGMLSTAGLEVVCWAAMAYCVIRMVARDEPRMWLWFGLASGLGLQSKHSTVFFGFALAMALLLTPQRRFLFKKWLLAGGAVAFLIFLPNLIWEVRHDWATLELLNNVKNSNKNVVLGPVQYFSQQILLLHPLAFPLWFGGLVWLLLSRKAGQFHFLGITYVLTFAIIVFLKGKNYYLAGAYIMLFAAGAVALERWAMEKRLRLAPAAYIAVLLAGGAALAPFALPLLPPEKFLAYQKFIGIDPPRTERSHTAALPQIFADCFGWREMAGSVREVWTTLTPQEQARTAIFAQNYGEAGALDVYNRGAGMPSTLSGHQNYWLWSTHGFKGDMLLVMDDSPGTLPELCTTVEDRGAVRSHPQAMPWEQQQRLFLCRGLKRDLKGVWPALKKWL